MSDELDRRLRLLEAERLRPVPPTPILKPRAITDTERTAARRQAATEDHLDEYAAIAQRRAELEAALADLDDDDQGDEN